jgi:hypothetical protein
MQHDTDVRWFGHLSERPDVSGNHNVLQLSPADDNRRRDLSRFADLSGYGNMSRLADMSRFEYVSRLRTDVRSRRYHHAGMDNLYWHADVRCDLPCIRDV